LPLDAAPVRQCVANHRLGQCPTASPHLSSSHSHRVFYFFCNAFRHHTLSLSSLVSVSKAATSRSPQARPVLSRPVQSHQCSVSFPFYIIYTSLGHSRYSTATTTTPSPCTHNHLRSEEHTSELQSRFDLVCRPL